MTMTRNLLAVAAAVCTVCALPMTAHAQQSSINLTGEVTKQCMLGAPATATLALGDLTGSDGKLNAGLLNNAALLSTDISNAWCNAPAVLTVSATTMNQGTAAPAYDPPAGFSRHITYTAAIGGWVSPISYRPMSNSVALPTSSSQAHAETLTITIGNLQTLNAGGTAEAAGQVVEAGNYSGTITLTLAAAQ